MHFALGIVFIKTHSPLRLLLLLLGSPTEGVRTKSDGCMTDEYTADHSDELVCYPTQKGYLHSTFNLFPDQRGGYIKGGSWGFVSPLKISFA